MEPITKTVLRNPGDRKEHLIRVVDRFAVLAVVSLPIIAGLETYYLNRYGSPVTTYIGGLCTLIYGIWLLSTGIRRGKSQKVFAARLRAQGRNVEERVSFSDDSFDAEICDYCTARYPWVALSSFKDGKRHLRFTLAGAEFMIAKKHFTGEELDAIKALLEQKVAIAEQALSADADKPRR